MKKNEMKKKWKKNFFWKTSLTVALLAVIERETFEKSHFRRSAVFVCSKFIVGGVATIVVDLGYTIGSHQSDMDNYAIAPTRSPKQREGDVE